MKPKITIFLIVILLLLLPALASPLISAGLPKVVVVSTGGTISSTSEKGGGAVPTLTGEALIAATPGLEKLARIEVVDLCRIDSSQMTPEVWTKLGRTVAQALGDPEIKGVVVTHGTDTMAQAAFFLETTLKTDKPVVLTGAMRSASDPGADGAYNLLNAVTIAVSPLAENWGVVVCLNDYINSARFVRKTHTTNVQAFDSGPHGYLGLVYKGEVHRWADRPDRVHLPFPDSFPYTPLITTFAGDDGRLIRQAVDSGAKGIAVEALGAGNVNSAVFEAIEYALSKEVVVVVAARVGRGGVWPAYGGPGGGATLKAAGCILAGDLSAPKARLRLMLALAQGMKKKDLEEIF